MFDLTKTRIGIVGLGYVGLPLAVEFGKHFETIGFDINQGRIRELGAGNDNTLEVTSEELAEAKKLRFTAVQDDLVDCNVFIVTVPTPINRHKWPDLRPLESASATIGKVLRKNDIVVYESTVYPGATEEVCIPVLERESGLAFNTDFYVGYSPERINPGDKEHRVTTILKITSGSTPETADFIDQLYRQIITAGTFKASSIKVAEAAKVIENTQRDVNIALINELAQIFNRIGIDTLEVLEAAGTKWNFLPFRPGLVGGHCIGVDPYYLTHKAQETGYQPVIIPASRAINEGMGEYVADRVIRLMARQKVPIVGGKVLILGFSFKENCPDLRNTRVIDIMRSLEDYQIDVDLHDPWVSIDEARSEYGVTLTDTPATGVYDAIIIAVAHKQFLDQGVDSIRKYGKPNHVLFDVKYLFSKDGVDERL